MAFQLKALLLFATLDRSNALTFSASTATSTVTNLPVTTKVDNDKSFKTLPSYQKLMLNQKTGKLSLLTVCGQVCESGRCYQYCGPLPEPQYFPYCDPNCQPRSVMSQQQQPSTQTPMYLPICPNCPPGGWRSEKSATGIQHQQNQPRYPNPGPPFANFNPILICYPNCVPGPLMPSAQPTAYYSGPAGGSKTATSSWTVQALSASGCDPNCQPGQQVTTQTSTLLYNQNPPYQNPTRWCPPQYRNCAKVGYVQATGRRASQSDASAAPTEVETQPASNDIKEGTEASVIVG